MPTSSTACCRRDCCGPYRVSHWLPRPRFGGWHWTCHGQPPRAHCRLARPCRCGLFRRLKVKRTRPCRNPPPKQMCWSPARCRWIDCRWCRGCFEPYRANHWRHSPSIVVTRWPFHDRPQPARPAPSRPCHWRQSRRWTARTIRSYRNRPWQRPNWMPEPNRLCRQTIRSDCCVPNRWHR